MLEFGRDVSGSSSSSCWHHSFLSLRLFPLCFLKPEEVALFISVGNI